MGNQNEREAWNERWRRQIAFWHAEIEDLLDQADAMLSLIALAKSQIQQEPPE